MGTFQVKIEYKIGQFDLQTVEATDNVTALIYVLNSLTPEVRNNIIGVSVLLAGK